jgi:hypothetical protein
MRCLYLLFQNYSLRTSLVTLSTLALKHFLSCTDFPLIRHFQHPRTNSAILRTVHTTHTLRYFQHTRQYFTILLSRRIRIAFYRSSTDSRNNATFLVPSTFFSLCHKYAYEILRERKGYESRDTARASLQQHGTVSSREALRGEGIGSSRYHGASCHTAAFYGLLGPSSTLVWCQSV